MSRRFYHFAYLVVRPIFWLLFPYRAEGLENVPEGGAVLCANHNNAVDPILIALSLPKKRRPPLYGQDGAVPKSAP